MRSSGIAALPAARSGDHAAAPGEHVRSLLIGLVAFVTVVDLFAAQAILPALTRAYGVPPGAMGVAVNASTFGMAAAGLLVALFSRHLDRRRGIVVSLILLSVPTALLAVAPDLTTFAALRIAQGICMATAFTLTLAYLGEHCSASVAAGAFSAYIAGNVASNLIGRLLAAGVADGLGLGPSFLALAAVNLAGAALVFVGLTHRAAMKPMPLAPQSPLATLRRHLGNPLLRPAFAAGFCILFAFIGTFTYVNFVLADAPVALTQAGLGLVYLVFLPSVLTTPLAGRAVASFGPREAALIGFGTALAGLPLLLASALAPVLAGLALVGIGTFFAQAVVTGFVSRAAEGDRGAASGLYLAGYFAGGLAGSVVLGQVYGRFGWSACVAGIGAALAIGAALSMRFRPPALYATSP
ncbi:MAG TPA: MFS transporter [Microvirga sp.]|jgi:predicted MFS family arabinose efflux permease|nr:MFS transporter [Microvirga sp.]